MSFTPWEKRAASQLGVPVEEYVQHRQQGERRCPRCKAWWKSTNSNSYCPECWVKYARPRDKSYGHQYAGPAVCGKPYSREVYP